MFLELNAQPASQLMNDVVYDLVYALGSGDLEVDEIASLIRAAVEDV